MYTSDHGGMLKSNRLYGKGPAMCEEITNVPLIVRWRGHAPSNVVSNVPVSHIEIPGTLIEYFGHVAPKVLEGASMLASIVDPAKMSRESALSNGGGMRSITTGSAAFNRFAVLVTVGTSFRSRLRTTEELYDLHAYVHEMNNLIDSPDHAELRNRMHDTLLARMDTSRDPFRAYYWGRRAAN